MASNLDGMIARLLAQCEVNGEQIDETQRKMDRMDTRLEEIFRRLDGVAYRRDIEAFMARDDIERRIEKATDGAKAESREAVAGVRREVEKLQGLVKWVGCGIIVAFGALLLRLIYAGAHIPI